MKTRRIHRTKEDIILDFVVYTSLIFLVIITLYPFLNTLAVSFNDALDSSKGGIYLWPRKFTLYNYRSLLSRQQIFHASLISVLRTVLSTLFLHLLHGNGRLYAQPEGICLPQAFLFHLRPNHVH